MNKVENDVTLKINYIYGRKYTASHIRKCATHTAKYHGVQVNEVYEAVDEYIEIKSMEHKVAPRNNRKEITLAKNAFASRKQKSSVGESGNIIMLDYGTIGGNDTYEKHYQNYLIDIKKRARIANIELEKEKNGLLGKKKVATKVRFAV